jgi:hypothetical protein
VIAKTYNPWYFKPSHVECFSEKDGFYNLDKVGEGDKVVLKDRKGRIYEYRVSETFLADPTDSWVTGQVKGGTWLRCRRAPRSLPSRSG